MRPFGILKYRVFVIPYILRYGAPDCPCVFPHSLLFYLVCFQVNLSHPKIQLYLHCVLLLASGSTPVMLRCIYDSGTTSRGILTTNDLPDLPSFLIAGPILVFENGFVVNRHVLRYGIPDSLRTPLHVTCYCLVLCLFIDCSSLFSISCLHDTLLLFFFALTLSPNLHSRTSAKARYFPYVITMKCAAFSRRCKSRNT